MAKRKRRKATTAPTAQDRQRPQVSARSVGMPQWRWRSFPVFCAFVAGLLIASVINGEPNNAAAAAVQIAALIGVIYAVVHLFIVNVVVAGRIRRRERFGEPSRPEDDEWVDEIVHPDEAKARR